MQIFIYHLFILNNKRIGRHSKLGLGDTPTGAGPDVFDNEAAIHHDRPLSSRASQALPQSNPGFPKEPGFDAQKI